MKLAFITITTVLLCIGCNRDPFRSPPLPEVNAADSPPVAEPGLTPELENELRAKGAAIVAHAFGVLSSRLGTAIAEAGHTNAIQFCSVHGIALTKSVGVTNKVTLRRVTHRPRNPHNRANTNELALIERFQAEVNDGATPTPVVSSTDPDAFTVYAPIILNVPLCLSCHGDPASEINRDVLAQIDESYPADEAKGFKLGQVRGMWRIDFNRSDFLGKAPN